MRMDFSTQPLAQAFANSVHSRMISSSQSYARSASAGQTTAWAIPYRQNGSWWVNVKDRAVSTLTAQERALLKPYG